VPGQLLSFEGRDALDATSAVPVARLPVELPRERRPGWPTLAALAIASGLAAIGLGGWAIVSGRTDAGRRPTALDARQLDTALAILADPAAERQPLRGAVGRIVLVASGNRAVLTLGGLGAPPAGRTYQAWVVPPRSATPVPAGTFDGSRRVVLLTRRVPPGARVGVTLEAAGGVEHPSRTLRLVALRRA
jgi:hypothetical protein